MDEQRQQAAVVEVGMGEDDGVEGRGITPSGTRLRIVSSPPPWNMPQSMRTRALPVSTRWREPVTVRAPPRKVSSMRRSSHIAVPATGTRGTMTAMSHADRLAILEAAYLDARDARDRLDVARATGEPSDATDLELEAAVTESAVRTALAAIDDDGSADDDARAVAAMRTAIDDGFAGDVGLPVSPPISRADCDGPGRLGRGDRRRGRAATRTRLEACYGAVADDLHVDGETLSRPRLLARLAAEPDADRRKTLFLALEPLWRTVDGDGGAASPYRALIRESAVAWAAGDSPIAANEAALGLATGDVERWATGTLEAWRDAVTDTGPRPWRAPIEPWDWWWRAGEAERALEAHLPLERVFDINRRVHAPSARTSTRSTSASTPRPGPAGRPSPSPSRPSAPGPVDGPTGHGPRASPPCSRATWTAASAS